MRNNRNGTAIAEIVDEIMAKHRIPFNSYTAVFEDGFIPEKFIVFSGVLRKYVTHGLK